MKSFEEIRAAPPVRPMPIVVLTAGLPQLTPAVIASGRLPPEVTQAFAEAFRAAQMNAIRDVVGAARAGKTSLPM